MATTTEIPVTLNKDEILRYSRHLIMGSVINGVAVVTFITARAVYWRHGIVMIVGAIAGGYLGAHYAMKLPQVWIRWFVVLVGAGMTAYFFLKSY